MKLNKIESCMGTLESFFTRPLPWDTSVKVCDSMQELQTQYNRYIKLKNKIISDHYDLSVDTQGYKVRSPKDLDEANEKFQKLDEQDILIEKRSIPRFPEITPKEMSYLRELFIFE